MSRKQLGLAIVAQAVMEVKLTLRRGESVLVTIIIPAALLVFFANARVLPKGGRAIDFLFPGTLALAVLSTSLVSLGIATAYERYYGVLKRYGATPLPRSGLLAGKIAAVFLLEAIQVALLLVIALAVFGWRPHGSIILALVTLVFGTVAFSGLALAMAGSLRAEATLATANALFIFFLLLGGLFVPLDHLPTWLVPISKLLPATALADVLRSVLKTGAHIPLMSGIVLTVWAVAMPLCASRVFRWE